LPGTGKLSRWLSAGILCIALPQTLNAEFSRGYHYEPSAAQSRFDQRKRYQDAIYYITSGQRSRYLKIKDSLRNYPLYPYLEYTDMAYRISRQSVEDMRSFADQYQDTPLPEQLIQHYLQNQGKAGRWQNFMAFADKVSLTDRNTCYHAYALARTGDETAAMRATRELWLVPFSQPKECDPIFKLWRDNGHLDAETAWERYVISIEANEITLANYLVRFLANEDRPHASNLKLVHTRPTYVARVDRYTGDHPRIRQLVLHGITRLARSKPDQAFNVLQQYERHHEFDPVALEATYVSVGKRLARGADAENHADALPIDLRAHPDLVAAQIRQALRQGNWSQVLVLLHLLPETAQTEPRWRYWKARVLSFSDSDVDRQMSEDLFRQLATQRNFYGFLSADTLQLPYDYEDQPIPVTNEEVLALELAPGIQRSLELLTIGERSRARREWYFTTSDFSNRERAIAARVSVRWGWYKPAIQSLIDAEAWNDIGHRFPIAYRETFTQHARSADIPVNWGLAIARQESAFMPDAKSSSGALGVMQLMPPTAKLTAQRSGFKYKSKSELTDPMVNIYLGSQYLGQMLRRFNNNRILASAAYNAGPSRVDRWINDELPFDVWIETIPFIETRNYVQNVLIFAAIYGRQLNLEQPMIYAHEYLDFSDTAVTASTAPVTETF